MPSLSSHVMVTINVMDENDNPPILTPDTNITLTCSYQTPVNVTIGKVKAYDADTGDNGKLGYFIQSGKKFTHAVETVEQKQDYNLHLFSKLCCQFNQKFPVSILVKSDLGIFNS